LNVPWNFMGNIWPRHQGAKPRYIPCTVKEQTS
jgi:hypothetical protein